MLITVAIPIYNAEKYLALAIQSVLNQTFEDFELILLDDGSIDNSLNIAKSFDDPRIRVISDGKNLGLPARLNQVTQLANYDLIARMDADDIIPDYRLKMQFDYMRLNPDIDLVTTNFGYIDGDKYMGGFTFSPVNELTLPHMLAGGHNICHASLLVRKSWYVRNSYDAAMARVEDYELWLRAFVNNDLKVGYLDVVGYYYRSDNTLTKNKFINTYKGSFLVAQKIPLPMFINLKFKIKLLVKMVLVHLIFVLDLQQKYLSKHDVHDDSSVEAVNFSKQLHNIKAHLVKGA
ncbi:glycosyltransferase family 2 protein [Pseudoalteromonas sp. 2CM36K]|uniref:glycosyltransferase family 2 protein n=1 Tax=Pseudoalteromonas sp. 2CM36K TaxID=2929854 RepID=UPI0020BE6FC0|nr:glycosyltransferase [Pseudoalteromonas sp. 2CM36K]MCK8104716.1 glycosyltransferase [Pseudoalteromonas sp. 2CM36K]